MDSKEGIEKTKPVDARVAGLLDPSHLWSGPDDTGASNVDTGMDLLRSGSPTGSPVPPDGIRKRESYCLFIRVLKDSRELLERDRLLPSHSWNPGICQDICEAWSGVPPGSLAVDLLSDTEFLLYKLPKMGQGMTYDESEMFRHCIDGAYLWGGTMSVIDTAHHTRPQARRDKTKTCDYRHWVTVEEMASAEACLKQIDLASRKREEHKKNPEPRGRGMTRWADEFFANQYAKGKAPRPEGPLKLPEFSTRPASPPDDFHPALDATDSSTDKGSATDDDGGNTTCSDQPSHQSGHDTDRSRCTNTSNRAKRRNRKKHKENWGRHPTNANKKENKHNGKVVLSLFQDSPKEGALTYTDWHREVEEYLRKGYDND